jgi:hypothetical protein
MFVVESISHRYIDVVPAVVSGLVATDQQNRDAVWVKGEERSIGTAFVLRPELTHVAMPGPVDSAAMRKAKVRSAFFDQMH